MTHSHFVSPRTAIFARPFTLMVMALFGLVAPVFSKSAEDYYHGAAYRYIEGKIQEAAVEADEGLRLHPGDERLRALADHLNKMKAEQRGGQGKGNGNDQDKSKPDQKDRDDQENEDKNKEGKNGDQQGENPEDKTDDANQNKSPQPEDDESRGGQGDAKPPAMSEAEAERLLNSFADDEKKEQGERRKGVRTPPGTEQDW